MAEKKLNKQQMLDEETMIDVGDEDEQEVDIDLDDNPNVVDQLAGAAEAPDKSAGEDDDDLNDEDILTDDSLSAEEKLNKFLEANPDVSDLRSKDIKGRIDKLTWEKNEAARREQAAIEYAQNVQKENASLKGKQQHQDGIFINEHKARLESQLKTARSQLREAHDAQDSELIADAQTLLSKTAAELAQAEQMESRFERFVKSTPSPESETKPYDPGPSSTPRPNIEPKAEAWAKKNQWFGDNEEMTQTALSIHETLVKEEGYIPTGDGYYAELDNRIRKNFPGYFNKQNPQTKPELQGKQVVTAPSAGSPSRTPRGKRNVRLTPSQVAIAKKLGVPLEEYAKYL